MNLYADEQYGYIQPSGILYKSSLSLFFRKRSGLKRTLILTFSICFCLFVTIFIGSGILSVLAIGDLFSSVENFLGGEDKNPSYDQSILNYDSTDLLLALEQGYIPDQAILSAMRLDCSTFQYLLMTCKDYEEQKLETRTIVVEGQRIYQNAVKPSNPDDPVTYEEQEEYVEKEITVSNAHTKGMLTLDWKLLYLYALFASMDQNKQSADFEFSNPNEPDTSQNSGFITLADIDRAFSSISMRYLYAYDVLEDTRTYYDYELCKELPHTTEIYGDPETSEGQYTFYHPTSLLDSAVSGYSRLFYIQDDSGNIEGIEERYEPYRFRLLGPSLSDCYSDDHRDTLLSLMPGGMILLDRFRYYEEASVNIPLTIYREAFSQDTGTYSLSADITYQGIQSDSFLDSDLGTGNPIGTIYGPMYQNPQTVGEAAVNLTLSRLSWAYSQERRMEYGFWDCSSMVSRVYAELGVSISPYLNTDGLKRQALDLGQTLDMADLKPGDVFWFSGTPYNHVVMYCGKGQIVHAVGKNYGTRVQSLQSFLNSTNKTLEFIFRPYRGLPAKWSPGP